MLEKTISFQVKKIIFLFIKLNETYIYIFDDISVKIFNPTILLYK